MYEPISEQHNRRGGGGGGGQQCARCLVGGDPYAKPGFFLSTLCSGPTAVPLEYGSASQCGDPVAVACPLAHGGSCAGGSACAKGYVGLRCGRCDSGHYMLMHKCHACGQPWAIWLCGVVLPVLVCAGCVAFLWFESGHQSRFLATIPVMTSLQIIGLYEYINIPFPSTISVWIQVGAIAELNFEILQHECAHATASTATYPLDRPGFRALRCTALH